MLAPSMLCLALLTAPASPRARAIERNDEGVALARRTDAWGAEQALREATRIDPSLTHAWLNLGQLQLRLHRPEDAAASFRKGLEVGEGALATELHLQLGLVLLASAQADPTHRGRAAATRDALEHLYAAVAGQPGLASVHVTIGRAHEQLDEPSRADAAYRRALEADPLHAPAYAALGTLYIDHGHHAAGLMVLELGTQVCEGDARAFAGLGRGLSTLGRPREALGAFERALQLDPHDYELLFWLGMTHAELRERTQAVERLEQFLRHDRSNIPAHMERVARDAIQRMQDVI